MNIAPFAGITRVLIASAIASCALVGQAFAGPSSTTLAPSSGSATFGETVGFTARVSGLGNAAPTGTVTFRAGATTLGKAALTTRGTGPAISSGHSHTCALTSAGGVKCWGYNDEGQLGDGTTDDSPTPVDVDGLTSGVVAIAAGYSHSCAVTESGGVRCWGSNGDGQLGNATTTDSPTPVDVDGLASGVVAVAAGYYHTCALTAAGGMKCWGYGSFGQLGNSGTANQSSPVDVTGLTSGVVAIAAGGAVTCALTSSGGMKCWGYNSLGQTGDQTTTDRSSPVDVIGLTSGVAAIAASDRLVCAVTTAGDAKCWGLNSEGQLGNGTMANSDVPVNVTGLAGITSAIAAHDRHACALTTAGGVKCWGNNDLGALGDGNSPNDSDTPVDVDGLPSGIAAISAGNGMGCAVTVSGTAKCWGSNFAGKLGDGSTTSSDTPVGVAGLGASLMSGSAQAVFSTDALAAGSHEIAADYEGDENLDASTSAGLTQIVEKCTTEAQIKLKPRKPKAGKTVRIVVKLAAVAPATGGPGGKVTVKDGRKKLGKFKVKNGKAKIKLRDLKAGKHEIKAKYPGDKNLEKSAAKASFTAR
jgi:alpha-tubulin suppressor-like RCC1 family protein